MTGQWKPTSEAPTVPGTYIKVRETTIGTFRWLEYRSDGKRQMGVRGRWQRATEFGWRNETLPLGEFTPIPEIEAI